MTTIKIGNARLLKLAAFLRTVPRKRFDYNVFVGDDWNGAQNLSCGTKACAMGWAATMPAFRRLGLYLDRNGQPIIDTPEHSLDVFGIARELFAVSLEDARWLFFPSDDEIDATPKQVARKIERFVAKRAA